MYKISRSKVKRGDRLKVRGILEDAPEEGIRWWIGKVITLDQEHNNKGWFIYTPVLEVINTNSLTCKEELLIDKTDKIFKLTKDEYMIEEL